LPAPTLHLGVAAVARVVGAIAIVFVECPASARAAISELGLPAPALELVAAALLGHTRGTARGVRGWRRGRATDRRHAAACRHATPSTASGPGARARTALRRPADSFAIPPRGATARHCRDDAGQRRPNELPMLRPTTAPCTRHAEEYHRDGARRKATQGPPASCCRIAGETRAHALAGARVRLLRANAA
jgi:hypothetical protein